MTFEKLLGCVLEEILAFLVSSPAFRSLVEGIALKIVADIFHRRATDPDFLAKSDALFQARTLATTDEDRMNVEREIQALMALSSS